MVKTNLACCDVGAVTVAVADASGAFCTGITLVVLQPARKAAAHAASAIRRTETTRWNPENMSVAPPRGFHASSAIGMKLA
ncbi:MAG: hypothetical protein ACYC1L_03810 [Alphaproteobacteria bacterium]